MARRELRALVGSTYRKRGDAIAGERVIAQARETRKLRVVPGTSKHQLQEVVLKRNVLCVIDKSFRLKDGVMRLRHPGN